MAGLRARRQASGAVAILRAVQARPGIERSEISRELTMTSGFVTETVARLTTLELLSERPTPPRAARGRPTTALHPHPRGPLVVAAAIAHERWRLAVVQLGGSELTRIEHEHRRDRRDVLETLGETLRSVRRRYGTRIRAVAIAVPGTVSDNRLTQAAKLGWHDVDLSALWPADRSGRPFLTGNDASFAAVAEAHRGAATGVRSALHLFIDAGVGGAVIADGNLLLGATGTAGEFGHMPFGDPSQACDCGARGCWNTTLDGAALARALGLATPADEVSYSRRVFSAARVTSMKQSGPPPELAAVQLVARSVGRGAAGLVNAFDPNVVTLGGIGRELLEVAGDHLYPAYLEGLMRFRAVAPPPLLPAHFGADAPLIGAAEEAFATVLTDDGISTWSAQRRRGEGRGPSRIV